MLQDFGMVIVILGVVLIVIGGILWLSGRLPFIGKLPGDILIKKNNFTFYFPLATSILISIILSVLLTFFALKK